MTFRHWLLVTVLASSVGIGGGIGDATAQTATPEPAPAASPAALGQVLYQADDASGFEEWDLERGWSVEDDMLVSDGASRRGRVAFPPDLEEEVADYAVEAEIQVVGFGGDAANCERDDRGFSIDVRESDDGWYSFELVFEDAACQEGTAILSASIVTEDEDAESYTVLAEAPFDDAFDWHTYRVEVSGSTLSVFVDGSPLVTAEDDRFPAGAGLALFAEQTELNVRRFTVSALT